MKNKPDFKHILIISPRDVCCQGLADVLTKHLKEPKYTFLNQLTDTLPDKSFDWSDIDLMIIDLSRHKRAIYEWYSQDDYSDQVPPAIFLGHPAKFKDAGFFFRVGAADYLELKGLKTSRLLLSLTVVTAFIETRRKAESDEDVREDSEKSLALNLLKTGEMPTLPAYMQGQENYEEMRADFINTGIMDILERDKLRKIVERQGED